MKNSYESLNTQNPPETFASKLVRVVSKFVNRETRGLPAYQSKDRSWLVDTSAPEPVRSDWIQIYFPPEVVAAPDAHNARDSILSGESQA